MTIINDHSSSFNLSRYYDNLPFIIANGRLFTITLFSFANFEFLFVNRCPAIKNDVLATTIVRGKIFNLSTSFVTHK